jgi:hypothetical protein
MKNIKITCKQITSLLSLALTIVAFNISKAQNYFPLQTDSLQFFKAFDASQALGNYLAPSGYKAIKLDSIQTQGNYTHYYNFYTVRDTGVIPNNACLDINAGSWLGKKIIKNNWQQLIFINAQNDSIFLNYNASIGSSNLFYQFSNNDKIMATVEGFETRTIYGITDSIKKISLQFYNAGNLMAAHPLNGKEIILSKNFGAICLPNFYYFPQDTVFLNRRFNMKMLTSKDIYNFNIGDVFCYAEYLYDINSGTGANLPDNYVYHILNKFYNTDSTVVNYGRWIEYYDTQIVPGVGINTVYSSIYDTTSYSLVYNFSLPEKSFYDLDGITQTTFDSIVDPLYQGISISQISGMTYNTANCYLENTFEPVPHYDIYGVGIGVYKKNYINYINGAPTQYKFLLSGYIKNGIQLGQITSLKASQQTNDNFFQLISIQNAKISIRYNGANNGIMNIYNAQGQVVTNIKLIQQGINNVEIPKLTTGVYLVEIFSGNQYSSKKIFIQ